APRAAAAAVAPGSPPISRAHARAVIPGGAPRRAGRGGRVAPAQGREIPGPRSCSWRRAPRRAPWCMHLDRRPVPGAGDLRLPVAILACACADDPRGRSPGAIAGDGGSTAADAVAGTGAPAPAGVTTSAGDGG